jgi:hypothetical protein
MRGKRRRFSTRPRCMKEAKNAHPVPGHVERQHLGDRLRVVAGRRGYCRAFARNRFMFLVKALNRKLVPGGNSGCEDPRMTKMGDRIYMCYTAYNGKDNPRVAFTSIAAKDFLARKWNWAKPVLISPPGA